MFAFHKSERAEQMVRAKGAWLLFLPPYSPRSQSHRDGLCQAEGAAAKARCRSFDAISTALGEIVDLFSVTECRNFFKAAGYEAQ